MAIKNARGPDLCRHRLGSELRRLREAASLRLEDVAAALEVAPSTVSRIETGLQPTRTSFVYLMLDMYRVEDLESRRRLVNMAIDGQGKNRQIRLPCGLPGAELAGAIGGCRAAPARSWHGPGSIAGPALL